MPNQTSIAFSILSRASPRSQVIRFVFSIGTPAEAETDVTSSVVESAVIAAAALDVESVGVEHGVIEVVVVGVEHGAIEVETAVATCAIGVAAVVGDIPR